MPTAQRNDPYKGFNFRIELADTSEAVAGFREVSGLTFTVEPVEYREGTDRVLHPRKLTGLRKFSNLTLKRGITTNNELRNWYRDVLNGRPNIRRNGAIILLDEEGRPVMRWNFFEGWICNWTGPTLNATANEVAIESIEIAVERVEME